MLSLKVLMQLFRFLPAGIADTGVDPCPIMSEAVSIAKDNIGVKILWASSREVLNIFQAAGMWMSHNYRNPRIF